MGVSLGGHTVWHCLFQDPRITTGIVVIGCPNYYGLMQDRARLSKLESWTRSSGSTFIGSSDFPDALVKAVETYDPTGLVLGNIKKNFPDFKSSIPDEKERLLSVMKRLRGKRIMNLAGAADPLVPYSKCENFLQWLKQAITHGGWYGDGKITLEDYQFDGVGHAVTPEMVDKAIDFIFESIRQLEDGLNPSSKI
jgi:pimeloyl-ACP methyl ester carboxylesterase